MTLPELEKIETQFDFQYPALYRQLSQDDMLYNGVLAPNWYEIEYPKYRLNPPLLLFGNDFELLYPDTIVAKINSFSDPDEWEISSDYRFIPFGSSGGGDLYCFYLNGQQGDDIPVVFVSFYSSEVTYLAKNLQDFIFRNMLEAVTDPYLEDVSEANFMQDIRNMLHTHSNYLSPKQQEIVSKIYARALFSYEHQIQPNGKTFTYRGLLTFDELANIVQTEIAFPELDQEFYAEE